MGEEEEENEGLRQHVHQEVTQRSPEPDVNTMPEEGPCGKMKWD